MKYLKQFLIIICITLVGEVLSYLTPLNIPASIYGMVILFLLLCTKVLKLESVRETGRFLVEIMGVMFVPATVGLIDCWNVFSRSILLYVIATVIATAITMAVGGLVTQFMSGGRAE